MTPLLRSRVARIVLLAVFVIPLGTSSLRGLTHVLICEDGIKTPFTISLPRDAEPTVTTSLRVSRESPASPCRDLEVNLGARLMAGDTVGLVVPISNGSTVGWRGTVQLKLDGQTVPVDIGTVDPKDTSRVTLPLRLPEGAHELTGTLLIGP